ncbi:hypothetical protein BSL78_19957 [Apostichopus japonicus]|uniref:Uncharacterized protein n=1 Tax=Stichopus japonicus TaxID=307972 RepID=A0A2G8K5B4_STIJA|nr:hypothetical protein BSL78_19957 [Apostichopus japonicus]
MAAPMSLHLLIKPKYLTSILSVVCGRTVKFQGVLPVTKSIDFKISPHIPFTASFAKKAGKGQPAVVVEEEPIEVNKNPEDLVKYCVGSNYFKEGSDVELNPTKSTQTGSGIYTSVHRKHLKNWTQRHRSTGKNCARST